ncbi:MAG TPA: type II toxin-antitoxin system VapC family toxin [Bryobacteraceae bacterium]|nr:type II toxin-antitoxin system VapC family toxin [Bryobacteraceae bacterium]
MLYLDSSALMKLYVSEPGSAGMEESVRANVPLLVTSRIAYAEVLSGLNRCFIGGRISASAYRAQKKIFLADWNGLSKIEVTDETLQSADALIGRHSLRGFDAIHLCSALCVGHPSFACFDQRLRMAAEREGLELVPPSGRAS